jgi:LysM domain
VGVRDGPSELLKNIVGFYTFGIGSKFLQDQFEHQVGAFRSSLVPQTRTIAPISLPKARRSQVDVPFSTGQPYFMMSGSAIELAIPRNATVQPSVVCGIRDQAIEAQKFLDSCVNPKREYVVLNNDSYWHISKELYGEGQFYHLLQVRTGRGSKSIAGLHPGQRLNVPAFYELQQPGEIIVSSGDTLWSIARDQLGNPTLYKNLIDRNGSQVSDPRKLTTLIPVVARSTQ